MLLLLSNQCLSFKVTYKIEFSSCACQAKACCVVVLLHRLVYPLIPVYMAAGLWLVFRRDHGSKWKRKKPKSSHVGQLNWVAGVVQLMLSHHQWFPAFRLKHHHRPQSEQHVLTLTQYLRGKWQYRNYCRTAMDVGTNGSAVGALWQYRQRPKCLLNCIIQSNSNVA